MTNQILEKEDVKFSGFWVRLVALMIDNVIVIILSFIPAFVFGLMGGLMTTRNEFISTIFPLILYAVIIIGMACYFAAFYASKYQATPGKMLFGIKVVDKNGERISFWRGIGRYAATFISSIFCLGYIMAGFHPQKRAFHDLLAGTYVIQADKNNEQVQLEEYAQAE